MGNSIGIQKKSDVDDNEVKDSTEQKMTLYRVACARFCDGLELLLLWASEARRAGKEDKENAFLTGNFGPVDEFGPERVLSVKGDLPECLNGEFMRVGPNPKFKPVANYHWFDGDGMIHGVRIKDGKVTYFSRYVATSKLKQEEYWGGAKFVKIGDMNGKQGMLWILLHKLRVSLGVLDDFNGHGTANTALAYHNGRLFSFCEGDKPYAVLMLEDGGLETLGRYDFDKKLDHSFTAHPKIDPSTGEMFIFGYNCLTTPYVTYRVISKEGVMGDAVPITVSGPLMMHDFAITENYAIFMECPLYFKPKEMVKNNQFLFSFDSTKSTMFGVLPRYAKTEAEIRWFEAQTCMIFHTANAWEDGNEVVLIACRMPSIELVGNMNYETNDLWEFRFNMTTGATAERRLGEFKCDFPRINEKYLARESRYVYSSHFISSTNITAVIKYDLTKEPILDNKTLEVGGNVAGVFWLGDRRYGSESVYVPRISGPSVDEDDGYLLNFVYDELTEKSEVVVIDAKTMSADPVAVIKLPTKVPFGFHGMFVSEEQIRSQKQA